MKMICLVVLIAQILVTEAFFRNSSPERGDSPKLELLPNTTIYKRVGESLELICRSTSGHLSNSASMYFTHKPDPLSGAARQEIMNSTSIRLTIRNVTTGDTGAYYCQLKGGRPSDTWPFVDVNVCEDPKPLEAIECQVDNLQKMTCTICQRTKRDGVHFSWKWTKARLGAGSCSACDCTFEKKNFTRDWTYEMTVVLGNKPCYVSTTFTIHTNATIVKPRPVKNLKVTQQLLAVNISWRHPINLEPTVMPLQYSVNVQSQWGHNETIDIPCCQTWLIKKNLVPYTIYTFTVRAKPEGDAGYWSDKEALLFKTKEGVPAEGPTIPTGAFRAVNCPGSDCSSRKVYIFWQELKPENRHGNITGYVVEATSLMTGHVISKYVVGGEVYSASLQLLKSHSYNVTVRASTTVGNSPPKTMYLPAADTLLKPVVIAEKTEEEVEFYIEPWEPADRVIDNYTLLWCKGDRNSCDSSPKVMYFPGNKRYFKLRDKTSGFVYSLSANSGTASSGMTRNWLCLYAHNKPPGRPSFVIQRHEERRLTVRWTPLQCDSNNIAGRVLRYNIYWQSQDGSEGNKTVEQGKTQYTITNLKPFHNYTVTMDAESRAGKRFSDSQSKITLESTPEDPPQNVSVFDIRWNSVYVSWLPTQTPNGMVTYDVMISDQSDNLTRSPPAKKVVVGQATEARLDSLYGFMNYTVVVRARNSAGASNSTPIPVQTRVGPPAMITDTRVSAVNNTHVNITWSPPDPPNGPLDHFVVYQESGNQERLRAIHEVRKTHILHKLSCDLRRQNISIRILAVNLGENGTALTGTISQGQKVNFCEGDKVSSASLQTEWPYYVVAASGFILIALLAMIGRRAYRGSYKRCCELPVETPGKIEEFPDCQRRSRPTSYSEELTNSTITGTGSDESVTTSTTGTRTPSIPSTSSDSINAEAVLLNTHSERSKQGGDQKQETEENIIPSSQSDETQSTSSEDAVSSGPRGSDKSSIEAYTMIYQPTKPVPGKMTLTATPVSMTYDRETDL